jgi:hypothetical protein
LNKRSEVFFLLLFLIDAMSIDCSVDAPLNVNFCRNEAIAPEYNQQENTQVCSREVENKPSKAINIETKDKKREDSFLKSETNKETNKQTKASSKDGARFLF